jgi:hypothetical protein
MQSFGNLDDILCKISCKKGEYSGFVPFITLKRYYNQRVPEGDLILCEGATLSSVIWKGQYRREILRTQKKIEQLNYLFGQEEQLNLPLRGFYVIRGEVPIEQAIINGRRYYVIDGYKKSTKYVAGFITYLEWVKDFIIAMNTSGTIAVVLSENSSIFNRKDLIGIIARQIARYRQYGPFIGVFALVLPDGTIIPYGSSKPFGSALSTFTSPKIYMK